MRLFVFTELNLKYRILGKKVLIVNGGYRGNIATMEDVHMEKFCATVKIVEVLIMIFCDCYTLTAWNNFQKTKHQFNKVL